MSRFYFDDPEVGPAKATSHPRFVALCWHALFYDVGDEFGPFGSDSGSDTLAMLEDHYRQARRGTVRAFITRTLREWDMRLPNLARCDAKIVDTWLVGGDVYLTEIDQHVIAAALGQLKITGAIDADVRALAIAASKREALSTAYYRRTNPAWKKHAAEKARADARILAALEAAG